MAAPSSSNQRVDPVRNARAAAGLALLRADEADIRCVASRYLEPELSEIDRNISSILQLDPDLPEARAFQHVRS